MYRGSHVEYLLFLSYFNGTLLFPTDFRGKKTPQIPNLMKIRPVGAVLFHADGQTTKLIVAFSNFTNAHKNAS